MSNTPQTFANHSRLDPWFHFFAAPVLSFWLVDRIIVLVRHPHHPYENIVFVLLAGALLTLAFRARAYSLKVQDRVIRLEERLRLSALLPEPLRARIPELTERELIALRFASDAEVPTLVEKTLAEKLEPKAIKQSIQNWRPDYWRV
jgi:Family of unknown function (DUF6526)